MARKDRAVELPPLLDQLRENFSRGKRDEVRRLHLDPAYKALFLRELEGFVDSLLGLMRTLPVSPGRKRLSEEELRSLKGEFDRVNRSMSDVRMLFKAVAISVGYRRPDRSTSQMVKNLIDYYFYGESSAETFRKFQALRSWLIRRTATYQKWAAGYYSRPEVKSRRLSKDADAERQYLRYWASKGVLNPPPRRPRRKKVVYLHERKTA